MRLKAEDIYVGRSDVSGPCFVVGVQFGPMLLCAASDIYESLNEWDERHGQRIDPDCESDRTTLMDYLEGSGSGESSEPGAMLDRAIWAAIDSGEARMNDGGTLVWVDHYEWIREFPNPRAAGKWFREWGSISSRDGKPIR